MERVEGKAEVLQRERERVEEKMGEKAGGGGGGMKPES